MKDLTKPRIMIKNKRFWIKRNGKWVRLHSMQALGLTTPTYATTGANFKGRKKLK